MFQFQLLIDRVMGAPETDLEGMSDLELIEFMQSGEGEKNIRKSIALMDKKIEGLKSELRGMYTTWAKKRELAKRGSTSTSEQNIIHTDMFHMEEQANLIREKMVSDMLEKTHFLKKMLLRPMHMLEGEGKLKESERNTIISALRGDMD